MQGPVRHHPGPEQGSRDVTTALAVASRDHVLPPPDRHTPRAHVLHAPEEQPFEAALEEAHALLEQHGYLIAVYPDALPRAHVHRLHAIRSVLESDRIALLPTTLPPLAVGVLVRQLRQLSLCDFSPGVLGASSRLLAHYVYAGALLHSVAKLDRVPVSLGAHAKSLVSRAQFAVLAAPAPELVRVGEAEGAELSGPRFATQLTLARGQAGAEWVAGPLARSWRVGEVREEHLPADSPSWWGTGKLTEFAAAIADVSMLYQLVASVRRDTCHWCGLELIGDCCAFCASPAQPSGAGRPLRGAYAVRGPRARGRAPAEPRGPLSARAAEREAPRRPQVPRPPAPAPASIEAGDTTVSGTGWGPPPTPPSPTGYAPHPVPPPGTQEVPPASAPGAQESLSASGAPRVEGGSAPVNSASYAAASAYGPAPADAAVPSSAAPEPERREPEPSDAVPAEEEGNRAAVPWIAAPPEPPGGAEPAPRAPYTGAALDARTSTPGDSPGPEGRPPAPWAGGQQAAPQPPYAEAPSDAPTPGPAPRAAAPSGAEPPSPPPGRPMPSPDERQAPQPPYAGPPFDDPTPDPTPRDAVPNDPADPDHQHAPPQGEQSSLADTAVADPREIRGKRPI